MDMRNYAITVTVSELDRESLKCVSFGHVVFDTVLELCGCEVTPADPLELIIGKRCR